MTKARSKARAPAASAAGHNWWRVIAGASRPSAAESDDDTTTTAEVLIFGNIGDDWFGEESNSARNLIEELSALPANTDRIIVRINSYGGRVADGLAIYNALRRHKAEIVTSVEGVAVSIASLITMAGDTIEMAENSLMMIHAPWAMALGNSRDMRAAADTLDTYAESMASSYARASGREHDDVLGLLTDGEDHWYTAQQAMDEGFAHEITDSLAVAASLRLPDRFAVPAALAGDRYVPSPEEHPMTGKTKSNQHDPNNGGGGAPAPSAGGGTPAGGTPAPSAGGGTPAPSGEPAPASPGNEPAGGGGDNVVTFSAAQLETRNQEIRAAFRPFAQHEGIRDLEVECLADPKMSADQARAKLLDKMGEGAEPATPASHAPNVQVGMAAEDKVRGAVRDAMLGRVGAAQVDASNEYRGLTLGEMARASLERAGRSTRGMSRLEVAEQVLAAQTTSDFPVILEDTIHKMVLTGYEAQPDTWSRFCRTGDVSDFRDHKRLRTGVIGNLREVNEAGEYQNVNIPDAESEKIAASRRGAIIQVTPEVLINDDLGEIQRMADSIGRSGTRTIETTVYGVLNKNPKLADGTALFHSNHNNLAGTGAAPGVNTLETASQAMAVQMDVNGEEYLDIVPAIAVVPKSLGGTMRTLIRAEYDPDAEGQLRKPNKVNGLVEDIVDSPRVNGSAWYLFADPAVAPVIEVVFLDGQRAPRIVQEENFRTAGLSWRAELPFGVAPVDYRGAYKNPGA